MNHTTTLDQNPDQSFAFNYGGAGLGLPDQPSRTPISLKHLSDLILSLYEVAQSSALADFQDQAMRLLARDLVFDSYWNGRSTFNSSRVHVHCSHLENVPVDTPSLMNLTDSQFGIPNRSLAKPDQAIIVSQKEIFSSEATAALAQHMQVANVLCISSINHNSGLANFVSVARRSSTAEFSEHERQLLELLFPHYVKALDLCCSMQLARVRQTAASDITAMATTDAMGFLHASDPQFISSLQREWPCWNGVRLPPELVQHIEQHRPQFHGQHMQAQLDWSGEHVLLALRPRLQQDNLSPQERAVASAFSSGQSYKEVARSLHLAPATVRHHLRSVYTKLGVSDKAALAHALHAQTSGR